MKFSTIGLAIIGAFAKCDGAIDDYSLAWNGCDKALGDISGLEKANIFCAYDILPETNEYKAELFGWSGVKGGACEGTKPPQVKFTNVDFVENMAYFVQASKDDTPHADGGDGTGVTANHTGVNAKISGDFFTDIDINRANFTSGGDAETFHFCIRHDVMESLTTGGANDTSLYFMKTFITVKFLLDGSFELNADSKGSLLDGDDDNVYTGDDDVLFDDKGNDNFIDDATNGGGVNVTENLTASEVFDEFNKTYSVFAYQCSLDADANPPHPPVDDIIYQGDNLGICVETLFKDTFILSVKDLLLEQDNGKGGTYSTKPVEGGDENVVTESNCDLKNRLGETQSKCFIKTAMLSQFFITQLIVNATGEVDLKIRPTGTNPPGSGASRRLDEPRNLQGAIDGSYTVRTVVGTVDEVENNSVSSTVKLVMGYAVMLSMLAVNLF